MGNKTIQYNPNNAEFSGRVVFGVTKAVYSAMQKESESTGFSPVDLLCRITGQYHAFLITRSVSEDKDPSYKIYLPYGVFTFVEDQENEDRYTLVAFKRNTLALQNEAMRYGTTVSIPAGIIFQVRLTDQNIFKDIIYGKAYDTGLFESGLDDQTGFKEILNRKCLNIHADVPDSKYDGPKDDKRRIEEQRQEWQDDMPPEMEKLLNTAENYAELASQLEQEKARASGKVLYSDIRPVLQTGRADRICYEFVLATEGLDETLFKLGGMAEFTDTQEEVHSAEIIDMIRKDPNDDESAVISIYALFTEQIDINMFDKQSGFTPSFSDVNKEVQEAAISRIRTFESKAAYDISNLYNFEVDGSSEVPGLQEVVKKLQQKKYPPNASQVHAITEAIKADDMYLVMGPPGTGKTTVILEWVKYFVLQEHKRVLVSSKNNKAVDNVLARLAEEKGISTLRIGSEAKLQEDVRPYMFENRIKTLRQDIISQIEEAQRDIEHASNIWQDGAHNVIDYIKRVQKVYECKQIYDKCRIEAGNNYALMKLDKGNIEDCQNRIKDLSEKNAEMRKAKEEARRLKGPKRIIFWVKTIHFKKEIQKNDDRCIYLSSLIERYQKENATMREKYEYNHKKYIDAKTRYEAERKKCPIRPLLEVANFPLDKNMPGNWIYTPVIDAVLKCKADTIDITPQINNMALAQYKVVDAYFQVTNAWKSCVESQQNYALENLLLDSVDLVGATCIGIQSKKRFKDMRFDITIIDEAGQIQVHDALVPLSLSPKFIMLGDQKQIPPMADPDMVAACEENNIDTTLLKKSLFEEWYAMAPDGCKIMLDTQYRMPGDIADTISEWFYDGKYISPPFKRSISPKDLMLPSLSNRTYILIDTSDAGDIRHEYKIPEKGSNNELEAKIAADLVKIRLLEIAKLPQEDREKATHEIGVISAYKAQVKLIRQKLTKVLPEETVRELVASLDSFQGQERDLIIYSFTKSSEVSPNKRRIGFLNELRRLNVAMSRCKKGLVMIGDMQFLQGCRHVDRDEDGNEIYDQSEKQFSDFIRKMYTDVTEKNRGQRFTYQEFKEKSEEILRHGGY